LIGGTQDGAFLGQRRRGGGRVLASATQRRDLTKKFITLHDSPGRLVILRESKVEYIRKWGKKKDTATDSSEKG